MGHYIALVAAVLLSVCALLRIRVNRSPLRMNVRDPRAAFWAFILIAPVLLTTIPAIYYPLDALFGGMNLASLFARAATNAAFLAIGCVLAGVYQDPRARHLLTGLVGIGVLVGVSALTAVAFLAIGHRPSEVGLAAYAGDPATRVYAALTRAYPAYVCLTLLPGFIRTTLSREARPSTRIIAAGMAVSFITAAATFLMELAFLVAESPSIPPVESLATYLSALLFAAMSLAAWVRSRRSLDQQVYPEHEQASR